MNYEYLVSAIGGEYPLPSRKYRKLSRLAIKDNKSIYSYLYAKHIRAISKNLKSTTVGYKYTYENIDYLVVPMSTAKYTEDRPKFLVNINGYLKATKPIRCPEKKLTFLKEDLKFDVYGDELELIVQPRLVQTMHAYVNHMIYLHDKTKNKEESTKWKEFLQTLLPKVYIDQKI